LKLLLLGHSHYGTVQYGTETTRHWLRLHIAGAAGNRSMMWSKCETLMSFCADRDARALWEYTAFANFIQVSLLDPYTTPTPAEWKTGTDSFHELLELLKPDVLLVLGRET